MIILFFAGTLTSSWYNSVVRADSKQEVAGQGISISGPEAVILGQVVQYQVQYNGVVVGTGGVKYTPPAGFTVTQTNPSSDDTEGSTLVWWGNSGIGESGVITIDGVYDANPCVVGDTVHYTELYDTHGSPPPTVTDEMTTTLYCSGGAVGGVVFNDINGDGVQGTGESGIAGVEILLSNSEQYTTTTDSNGNYLFEHLLPDIYTVVEFDPDGFVSTTPNARPVVVMEGGTARAIFGDQELGTVSGTVFEDLNGDGEQDDNESGIAGITITLANGSSETATTDANGIYQFTNVSPGNYTVIEQDLNGYISTTANQVDIVVPAGGSATASFGDQLAGTVSGVVFNDFNGDGIQNDSELGISGVTVQLINGTTRTATTNADGIYEFTNVASGSYIVQESDPSGFVSTTSNSVQISVPSGGSATANFGDQEAGTVSGTVFNDLNANGMRDNDEVGIPNVTITLSNGSSRTTTTDNEGNYKFINVNPGSHTVTVQDLAAFFRTTPGARAISVPAGGSGSANFGYQPAGMVSGVVFNDLNGNGQKDQNESGIGGALITLSNGHTITTTTAGNGSYIFTDVYSGTYTVIESDPSGYISTTPNTRSIFVAAGGSAAANFGDQRVGIVSGVVFNDINGDRIQNGNEQGLSGVRVTLNNGTSREAFTVGNGSYSFTEVTPGVYTVIEEDPQGYFSTTSNSRSVLVPSGGSATANFGDQQAGIVSGVVFNDANGNGVQDFNENGLAGVTITLNNNTTTTTAGNGSYTFLNVRGGTTHTVVETDPTGFVSTTPNARRIYIPAGGSGTASFGDQSAAMVSGVVFNDLNGNGIQDGSEGGIGGVRVRLINNSTRQTTTAGDGSYSFSNITSGAYTVQESDPSGYVSTTPNSRTVSVAAGGSANANFGDQLAGTVSGLVFNDLDGDGVKGPDEPGLAGVKVELVNGQIRSTTTVGDGSYLFTNVTPGAYSVKETDPNGFVSTTINSVAVSVASGGSATASFGDQQTGTVSGVVYDDLNGNGQRDAGEPGIAGVAIALVNGTIHYTTTAGDGSYLFTNVTPGAYAVEETDPKGYVSTTHNAPTISLAPNGSASVNFGDQQLGQISGQAFNDLDGNQIRNPSEAGMGGVQVKLLQNGVLIATTVTTGDGSYNFSGVTPPGQYTVCVTTPTGFVPTTLTCRTITLGSGSSVMVHFGFQQAGSISGIMFNDFNGNGQRNPNEAGLGGVLVSLRQNGSIVASTSSSGDGNYIFSAVSAGNYDVCATNPPGFTPTTPLCRPINLPSLGSASANFGFQQLARLSGIVFNDFNGDGDYDSGSGELGIGGVTVQLFDSQGKTTTTTTSSNGSYSFENLTSGNYSVFALNPAGFIPTCVSFKTVSIVAGSSASANFCFQRTGTVSGVVFEDINGNGLQDRSESGIGGVLITRSGGINTTTTTNGSYLFNGVVPGNHTITETDPPGYISTTPNNVNLYIFPGGGSGANFGDQGVGTISGSVCEDLNGNAKQDDNEVGIPGVEIRLLHENGVIDTTNTSSNGSYQFSNVLAGNYRVVEIDPPRYSSTTSNEHTISIRGNSASTANFCDRPFSSISGIVFQDSNGNGIQDGSETGIGGVRIELASIEATRVMTTTGNGSYIFDNVSPGNYTVIEFDLDGYVSTTANHRAVVIAGAGSSASANFGDQLAGLVTGVVFDDLDGDGIHDSGETGLAGVEVQLSNSILITTTTVGDGSYIFNDVVPGNYTVFEIDPDGYTSTTSNHQAVTVSKGGSASANFGDQLEGTVSGMVFDDSNGNGIQDYAESGLGSVNITLSNGSVISTTTVGNGFYQFINVSPGNYTVCEEDLAGFVSTTPNCYSIVVSSDGSASANFGDQAVGSVTGMVFDDSNGNGQRDDTESGIGDVLITLNNNVAITTTTNGDGSYSFINVTPGSYTIIESDPNGYVSTTPNSQSISVAPAGSATANFGDQATGTVGGTVFYDFDGNGIQDLNENGLGQVEVRLVNDETAFTLTTGDGTFLFTDVTSGSYTVQVIPPTGVVNTTPNTQPISLGAGGSASASFGFQPVGSVSGVVFNDSNGNGEQDPTEGGIGGVSISLIGNSSTMATTTTNNGSYSFADVAAGSYTVLETDPDSYVSTTNNTRSISVAPGGSATANFGDQLVGSVSGVVFNDLNSNGVQDNGEVGIGGVVISLINGETITTTTTGDGSYSFTGIAPESYTVQESDPDGFVSTTTNNRVVNLSEGGSVTANFGDQQTSSISGTVFNDLNANGYRDSGEPGIGGVLITLSNQQTYTTTTAGDGTYSFSGLTPGNIAITESDPDGFISTTPNGVLISLVSGSSASVSFGDQQTATVSGIVFNDLNGDGIWQAGELGIGGVQVELIGTSQTVTTTTAGNGLYLFSGVTAGAYTVYENDPEGFVSSSSNVVDILVVAGNSASANFGDQQEGTISGTVFEDMNGNRVRDAGESGLSNVEVLKINIGSQSIHTAGDGSYFFANVTPALYTMVEIDPQGFRSTTANTRSALVTDNGSASADFGDQLKNSISGAVFNDLNGNKLQEPGEPSISDVVITLVPDVGQVMTTTTTGNGIYQFQQVSEGRYTVRETDPLGFTSTTPNSVIVAMARNGVASANFGDSEGGMITGNVFNDSNNNQQHDGNEGSLSGVTVSLYRNGSMIATTQTFGDGSFAFQNLLFGSYTVEVSPPNGFVSTTLNPMDLFLASGGNESVSFGFRTTNTINGNLFSDFNGNGIRENLENGLGGVSIKLRDANGNEVATVATDGLGNFEFLALTPGTYTVEAIVPAGYANTRPNPVTVNLQTTATVRFGFAIVNNISGQIVARINWTWGLPSWAWAGSGVPLPDVTVELYDNTQQNLLQTTTTAGDGSYNFTNLSPGTYWVHHLNPPYGNSGWWYLQNEWQLVNLSSGSSAVANFNLTYDPCVVGLVYSDLNLDGAYNDGEPTLSGVHIRLLTTEGTVVRETDTEGDGSYLFKDVNIGTYLVEVQPPAGWTEVTENPVSVALVEEQQGESVSFGLLNNETGKREPSTAGQTGTLYGSVRDANGQGLAGIKITVKDQQNNQVAQVSTIANGSYRVNEMPTGRLIVETSIPSGYVSQTPNTRTVYLSPDKGGVAHFVQVAEDAAIRGTVYRDSNGNGQRDSNEIGIGGIAVRLEQNGQVIDSTTTTVRGDYSFPLVEGVVDIVSTDAEDHLSTTPNTIRSWGPAVIDFGDRFIGSEALRGSLEVGFVAGRIYDDIDGSGTLESNERVLGGIVVTLQTLEGTEVMTATTTGDGEYVFENVTAGAYKIVVDDLAGFLPTSPSKMIISVGANSATSVNFGYRHLLATEGHGSIVGRIFNDLNSDQRFNPNSETPLAGIQIKLFDLNSHLVAETLSSGDGSYALNDMAAGRYTLWVVTQPTGFVATTPTRLPLMVAEGELTSVSYGLLGSYTVGGSVFFDNDGDTKRHSLERGVGGLTVSLHDSNGSLVGEATTSVNGDYLFTGLVAGNYSVELSVPEGLVATSAAQANLHLLAESGASRNFGLQAVGTISGIVFQDLDGDGKVNETEIGLSGVNVSLLESEVGVSETTTTFSNGFYQLLDLAPGTYTVTESDPTGFTSSQNEVSISLEEGTSGAANFGDLPRGRIGGTVFNDVDESAVMENGEPGFGGAKVQLLNANGAIISTVTARANGTYAFDDLAVGSYRVVVIEPSDFLATTPKEVTVDLAAQDSQAVNFGLNTNVVTAVTISELKSTSLPQSALLLTLCALLVAGMAIWRQVIHNRAKTTPRQQ